MGAAWTTQATGGTVGVVLVVESNQGGVRVLSERERALLLALREAEGAAAPLDVSALARRTGYAVNTIKTYLSKKLEGVLVFRERGGWIVRGALRCSEAG